MSKISTAESPIGRRLKKTARGPEHGGGRALYPFVVSRENPPAGESRGLLDRLFGGRIAPLVAHYARHRDLSTEQVARLKRLITELETDDE